MEREETVMVSARVPQSLQAAVLSRAGAERRTFTSQVIVLLERGLGVEVIVDGTPLAPEVPVGDGAPPVEPQPAGMGPPLVEPHAVQDAPAGQGDDESPFPAPELEEIGVVVPAERKPFRPDFKKEKKQR